MTGTLRNNSTKRDDNTSPVYSNFWRYQEGDDGAVIPETILAFIVL